MYPKIVTDIFYRDIEKVYPKNHFQGIGLKLFDGRGAYLRPDYCPGSKDKDRAKVNKALR